MKKIDWKIDWKLAALWFVLISAPVCYFLEKMFPTGRVFFNLMFLLNLGILIALLLDEFWQIK